MILIVDLQRLKDETEEQYLWRIGQMVDSKKIENWKSINNIVNEQLNIDFDQYRDESSFRKRYQAAKNFYDNCFSKKEPNEYQKELQIQQREILKERVKLQTEKLEYNRWIREEARDELFEEKVIEAIKSNRNNTVPPRDIEVIHNKRLGQLNFTDSHFGKDFKLFGLNDEVINEYSPEIFYSRMEQVYNETIDIVEKEGLTEIHVNNLGDHIEGFIRHSQIWTLRYGAIDSAIMFGNYMGDWLYKLSHKVSVIYHQTSGNHDEFRILDGKKDQHLCENSGNIIKNIIILKNENNPNFKYVDNKTGFIFNTIAGYNILGIHGEVKDLVVALKDYSEIYDVRIDYIIAGHKHHSSFANCGVRKGAIGVGSIVGSDDFSMKIRKSADATATFIMYEYGKGKVMEHTIVLN